MAPPNPWQDTDDFARSIADQARQNSEAAMGKASSRKGKRVPDLSQKTNRDRPTPPPINPLDDLPLPPRPSAPGQDPDEALARLIADRARRQSEAYIDTANGAGDRLWLYLILTPGIGMALSPWILVRSGSTIRQRQAGRFALGVGIVWLAMTLLSAGGGDIGPLTSLNSATTWIYVFLMLSQMVRVWQRKSLPIKR